jgi:hypothetical protein
MRESRDRIGRVATSVAFLHPCLFSVGRSVAEVVGFRDDDGGILTVKAAIKKGQKESD